MKPTARSLGLTLSDLAQQVRHAFYGCETLRLQRDKDEVKVMVRYPEVDSLRVSDFRGCAKYLERDQEEAFLIPEYCK